MGNGNEPLRFLPRDGARPRHPVMLAGLRDSGEGLRKAPALLERRDQDFVEGLWEDLREGGWRKALVEQAPRRVRPRGHSKALPRLHAPVQRVFNLAVLEAFCDEPGLIAQPGNPAQPWRTGLPRLDPLKIESSGMVLRRVLPVPAAGARYEAWFKSGTRFFGWDAIDPAHEDDDPSAARRMPAVSVGHPGMNALLSANVRMRSALSRRLAGQAAPVHEQVMPLYVAPPDVNAAVGKTVLFGVVQVASSEQSEGPAAAPGYGKDPQERKLLGDHLVNYLKEGGPRAFSRPGEAFDSAWALRVGKAAEGSDDFRRHADIAGLTAALQQLAVEFDAFGTSKAAGTLLAALNALQVEYDVRQADGRVKTTKENAGDFFRKAQRVVLLADAGASFTMPHRVATVSAAQARAVLEAALGALDEQYRKLKPARGRFEPEGHDREARYVLRAFLRLKPSRPGCPGRIVWSPYSEEFTIAPWYESAGQPPTMVDLPDLFDRDALKALKPNVAFAVPPKLAKLIAGDPMDLRDGKGDEGDGLGLGWICSFSIPIITICAFIVLSIFLSLLNLVFWWLPFLKICIPFPKKP